MRLRTVASLRGFGTGVLCEEDFKAFVLDHEQQKGIFLAPTRSLDDALSLSAAGHLPSLFAELGWVPTAFQPDEVRAHPRACLCVCTLSGVCV